MNAPLKFCAAGLLAICAGCGVYLTRPSSSVIAAPAPESIRSAAEAHEHGVGVQRGDALYPGSENELQVDDAARTRPAVVAFRGSQPPNAGASSYVRTVAAASALRNGPAHILAAKPADRTAPVREAEGQMQGMSSAAAQARDTNPSFTAELAVPFGASLPAAFLDSGLEATPAQVAALDRIASDFVQEATVEDQSEEPGSAPLSRAGGKRRETSPRPYWDSATAHANEQYRLLFGVEAYNARVADAAREALAERQGKAR